MAESFSMDGYEWISFYLSNLFKELGTNFDFDFNNNSDLVSISFILAARMYESEVDNWLKTVKSALYEAEDLQDQYLLLEDRLRKGSQIVTHVPSYPLIRPFEKITQKILKAPSKKKRLFCQLKRLRDLISEASFFSRALGILDKPMNENQCREKFSILQTIVLGCDGECESIIKLFVEQKSQDPQPSSSQSNSTVAIIGQPGCGKTTLAQYIFNDVRIARHFETRIWLCVSDQKLDIYSHTSKMVKSILIQEFLRPENQEALLLKRILEDEMQSNNTLFVLDDVQGGEFANTTSVIDDVSVSGLANNNTSEVEMMNVDEEHWEQVLASFSRFRRCKILVTSQSHKLPLQLHSSCIFPKNKMTEQDLFSLLMHSAFGDHRGRQFIPPDVKRIGHEIVKWLNFPADAKLIGSQLRAQTNVKAWEKVLERVNSSDKPSDIYLRLTEPLKRCFLFCSIFPKGYKHEMDNLIQLWVAECFIKALDPVRRATDIGKEYFQELLTSSVFKPIQEQESDIVLYTMDDLFHHLADHMSADDRFRLEGSDRMVIPPSVYHLSVHTEKLKEHRSDICNLHNLRTLILFGPVIDDSYEILEEIFLNLRKLRVLDISLYNGNILPKSIGNLKQLRYLNHSTTVTKLPKSIHKIQNLQFLKHKPDG